jgi:hypothetical protein
MQATGDTFDTGAGEGAGGRGGTRDRELRLLRSLHLSVQLRRFAARYFGQLDAEYDTLCPTEYKRETCQEVAALRASNEDSPGWIVNHRLEQLLLAGLPETNLRQRAVILRHRLLALVGPEGAQAFGEAFPAPRPEISLDELRAATLGSLVEIQRLRNVRSEFERLRNRLIGVSMVPSCGFVLLATVFAPIFPDLPLAAIAAIFGLLGGYLSALLRLSSMRWTLSMADNYQQVDRVFWNIFLNFYLCILEGALGAIILYVIFSAGILKGAMFPTIPDLPQNNLPLARALEHHVEAQLMLWSLVAGFSERIVPDFLSGLGREVTRSPQTRA